MSSTLLILPRIRVQNANAFSSAISVGFPAVTGFMGAVHALERKARDKGFDVRFNGVGIISHMAEVQTLQHRGAYQKALIGKAQVINKDGSAKSFIPDARVHLTVSLVIECEADGVDHVGFIAYLSNVALKTIRLAGGDIIGAETPYLAINCNPSMTKAALNKLMPGYALIDRSALMREAMQDGQDSIDALLDFLQVKNSCEQPAAAEHNEDALTLPATWRRSRKAAGWLVPVGVGFHGLTLPGKAKHVRDDTYPHRFAESVVSLGEFMMVHKVNGLDELLWHYNTEAFNDLYLCVSKRALNTNIIKG